MSTSPNATIPGGYKRHARMLAASACDLGTGLERMIRTQMTAYPDHWSEADKREVAELHLFGRADQSNISQENDHGE